MALGERTRRSSGQHARRCPRESRRRHDRRAPRRVLAVALRVRRRAARALEPACEYDHLLLRLLVALALRDRDALSIRRQRLIVAPGLRERLAVELPCRGVRRLECNGALEVARRERGVAILEAFVAQRETQQRVVLARGEHAIAIPERRGPASCC